MTQLVEHVEPGNHLVQFYDAESTALVTNLAGFIGEGLERGDSVVIIATPEHGDAFVSALGASRNRHDARAGRPVMLDAAATLELFMVNGQPDWQRFEHVVGGTLRGLRRANPSGGIRAYGEMVGLLWSDGQAEAAVQLEKFWNVLLGGKDFTLFCGYPIDVFADEFHTGRMHGVLCTHTHVVPGGSVSSMAAALDRALRDVLGNAAEVVYRGAETTANPAWAALPNVEATILWLREHQPAYADEVLARARTYYTACP